MSNENIFLFVTKFLLAGVFFALLNLIYFHLSLKKEQEKAGYVVAFLLVVASIIVPLLSTKKDAFGWWQMLITFIVLSILWSISLGIFRLGLEKGKKYWRNHVEKFYAYGIGVFITLGFAVFIIVGNYMVGSVDSEDFYDVNKPELNEIITITFSFFSFLLLPYCSGVFAQNRLEKLNQKENKN